MKKDIYNTQRMIERTVERIKSCDISEKNKELIFKFQRSCVLNNIGDKRISRCIYHLRQIAEEMGIDFDKATKEDIQDYIQKLQESNYTPITKSHFKTLLKKFYKWLKGNDVKYPEEVEWIKSSIKRIERHLPGEADLITEDEVKKLINVAEHPRDKAFISCLYESGCRIGELCSMCIKDVKFDEHGALVHVTGKTGPRQIRLISSVPFLSNWINNHPGKEDRDVYLWISYGCKNHNRRLFYPGIYFLLKRLFKRAGIKKKFNPHLFRHSRATYLASHLTEFQMNQYFGWVQGSGMPSTYVHLSGKNIDNAILELNGVNVGKNERKESELKPKRCPRCEMVNSFSDKFCSKCGCVLDMRTAMEMDEKIKEERKLRFSTDKLLNVLMNDEGFQRTLVQKAIELGISKELKE